MYSLPQEFELDDCLYSIQTYLTWEQKAKGILR